MSIEATVTDDWRPAALEALAARELTYGQIAARAGVSHWQIERLAATLPSAARAGRTATDKALKQKLAARARDRGAAPALGEAAEEIADAGWIARRAAREAAAAAAHGRPDPKLRRAFARADHRHCAWPLWEDGAKERFVCGAPPEPARGAGRYCAYHAALAYDGHWRPAAAEAAEAA